MDNLAKEWSKVSTVEAKLKFLASRMGMVQELREHYSELSRWRFQQKEKESEAEKDSRETRYERDQKDAYKADLEQYRSWNYSSITQKYWSENRGWCSAFFV
ncbi:hypothetical protein FRC02_011111 [Tulasnella sp. 418]|nr:hypothetical protein FRC02_011111 [Tulasnella sp. 418]